MTLLLLTVESKIFRAYVDISVLTSTIEIIDFLKYYAIIHEIFQKREISYDAQMKLYYLRKEKIMQTFVHSCIHLIDENKTT